MEESFEKKKNIINPEFKDAIQESEESIKLIQEQVDILLKNLSELVQYLKEQEEYLSTIKTIISDSENWEKLNDELSQELKIQEQNKNIGNVYTEKDVTEVSNDIIRTKEIINKIKTEVAGFLSNKITLKKQIEEFKNILMNINNHSDN